MSQFACEDLWTQLDNQRGIDRLHTSHLGIQKPKENEW